MRFDALGASIRGVEAGYVADVLKRELGGMLIRGKPLPRYSERLELESAGRQVAWVGFDSGNGLVYVEGKGETTPELVGVVRRYFPEHTAPRLDVCEDYNSPGAFEALQSVTRSAAVASRGRGAVPKLGYRALPDDPVEGKTWGTLTRGGVAHLRIYEPGKMAERRHWGPDAARVELEARPHSPAEKRAAASMTPLEVWGLAAWSRRVGEALTGCEIPRFEPPRSVYTADRTTAYLARTFEKFWREKLADHGDWECVGRSFEEVWRLDAEAREALKRRS